MMMSPRTSRLAGLILDMDGVLWRGAQPLGDLPGIFATIEQLKLKVTLATNNATRSLEQYLDKLHALDVDLEPWQIINTALTTALYLRRRFPAGGPVYSIGEQGLIETLAAHGFYQQSKQVYAVIVSLDREFNYDKMDLAMRHIQNGALFIGTNPDLTFPTPAGLSPGTGSILAAVQAASGTDPIIIGKPQPEMFNLALERMGTKSVETMVVGDRLETDIAGGQAIGCQTALVLSGVTAERDAHVWEPAPSVIAPDLTTLLDKLSHDSV